VNEGWTGSPMTDYVSYPLYRDVRDHNQVLSGLYANGAAGDVDVVIGADHGYAPERPATRFVSGNFFSVLELPAYAGRTFVVGKREVSWLVLVGRLAPGGTLEAARAILPAIEANAVRAQLTGVHLTRFEEDLKTSPIRVESGRRGFSQQRETYGPALIVLMAA